MASSSVARVENKNVQEKRANERAEERERGEAFLVDDMRREGETRISGGKGGEKG